jgi:hypothetical protein
MKNDQIEKDKGARYVARTLRREVQIGIWWGKLDIRDHLEKSGLDGR